MLRASIIIAAHNRVQSTIKCLRAISQQKLPSEVSIKIYLVDDGSTDGTSEVVTAEFPEVMILNGDGSLYWNGGMRLAFAKAMDEEFDYLFWINDDTVIFPETLTKMIVMGDFNASKHDGKIIVVGTTQDIALGKPSYGGLKSRSRYRPLSFQLIFSESEVLECETMNGNCVMLSKGAVADLGNLDPDFVHTMGDIDYGLRASRRRIPVLLMPDYAGTCSVNPTGISGFVFDGSFRNYWKGVIGVKGLPPKQWYSLVSRHAGWLWPLLFVWPYIKAFRKGVAVIVKLRIIRIMNSLRSD